MSRNQPIGRRKVLLQAGACVLGAGWCGEVRAAPQAEWAAWTAAFLRPDGRVVDRLQGGASHSEGQGYGMLLAQAHGDREAFRRMEAWAARVLAIRPDGLMAWRWRPEDGVSSLENATDGDLFRAWALWRAEAQSGWTEFAGRAGPIAAALAERCLATDPRTRDEPLLTPSAESARGAEGVLFNPSYIMPRALRELGIAHDRAELIRAADHGETVLAELSDPGLAPDWSVVTADGFRAPARHSALHGYDALRVPLFLVWSGAASHPAVAQSAAFYQASGGRVPTVATRDGKVLEDSDLAGYHALRALVTCAPPPDLAGPEPYYPATLGLMTQVARREGGACRPA
ncbi:glycosyl hydrolase family 8 [Pseudooceanicola sp.]|uniref:glycosyl hydrolase family 8 n=1 Tax=Pseudooceanicola sp. TaxID=1914328 RepID=UPI004059B81F